MQNLGMQGGRFEVALISLEQAAQHGLEDIQFLVAGHAGSTPRPVGKVASGGELAHSFGYRCDHQRTGRSRHPDI